MVGFVTDNKERYAGKHVLVDMYGCSGNMSSENILDTCSRGAEASGATVLFKYAHPFEPNGSSGVIVLAESHISWHTWPEEDNFMAFDIFVCGDCDPMKGVEVLLEEFNPKKNNIRLEKRGASIENINNEIRE